jgi:hypothetical protein
MKTYTCILCGKDSPNPACAECDGFATEAIDRAIEQGKQSHQSMCQWVISNAGGLSEAVSALPRDLQVKFIQNFGNNLN